MRSIGSAEVWTPEERVFGHLFSDACLFLLTMRERVALRSHEKWFLNHSKIMDVKKDHEPSFFLDKGIMLYEHVDALPNHYSSATTRMRERWQMVVRYEQSGRLGDPITHVFRIFNRNDQFVGTEQHELRISSVRLERPGDQTWPTVDLATVEDELQALVNYSAANPLKQYVDRHVLVTGTAR